MNLEPAPRLPKLPFFIADAIILGAALLLAKLSAQPLDSLTIGIIAILVVIGAALAVAPFIAAYLADENEQLDRERQRVNDQVARLHAATESLARAAAQIKAVEEAVHKAARDAETLPYRMQEKLAEFNEALAAKEDSDREALETELEELRAANSDQLKSVAEKIAKAAADWTALEVATRKQLTAAQTAATEATKAAETAQAKFQTGTAEATAQLDTKLATALKEIDAKLVALQAAAASIPTTLTVAAAASSPVAAVYDRRAEPATAPDAGQKPALPEEPKPAPAAEVAPTDSAAPAPSESAPAPVATETPATVEPPKPKKPRAPRKTKAEDTLLAMSAAPAAAESAPEPGATAVAAVYDRRDEPDTALDGGHRPPLQEHTHGPAPEPEPVAAPEPAAEPVATSSDDSASEAAAGPAESSTSSDGATRLLATAYIGIGNKLYIRGDGPGLSWDHGVAMQFVSIGKWGWFTHEAAGPIRCKLYKNDETAALTGEITLEAGRHTEVTALF